VSSQLVSPSCGTASVGSRRFPAVGAFLCLLLLGPLACAQTDTGVLYPLRDYQDYSDFLPTTPSVAAGAVGALANPAAWSMSDRPEYAFWWDDRDLTPGRLDDFGFSSGRILGAAYNRTTVRLNGRAVRLEDYQLGLSAGVPRSTVGLAYRWSSGDADSVAREDAILVGMISRPNRYLSLGLAGQSSVESDARLGIADVGLRPFGRDYLTLFADYSLRDGRRLEQGWWGAGIEIRPMDGVQLGVKLREVDRPGDDLRITYHVGVTLAGVGLHVLPGYSEDGELTHMTYLIQNHPSTPSLPVDLTVLPRPPRYIAVDLEDQRLTYQKYRWFDEKRTAWLDLLSRLEAVRDSDADGVAVNLGGLTIRPSLAWELRGMLAEIKATGKEVVVQIDRVGPLEYYLASVADRLVIDPLGLVVLPGVVLERTYLHEMLAKLGLGFQELRYFEYKSALETYSRDSMSPADSLQRARIVDVVYDTFRAGPVEDRELSAAAFDSIVDGEVVLTAELARVRGLVDGIGRWADLQDWLIVERDGAVLSSLPADEQPRLFRNEQWGPPPRIMVVYAVGSTAMETGIKGRSLAAALRRMADDAQVAAVVLRVDSPGGDALPSDLVAAAIGALQEAGKPVVVSQGDVAASGGYWLSMRGNQILTTPLTITGSIGVIAGWVWNDGLGQKLGLTTDGVWRGAHADLQAGMRLPLLGQSLPTRPLDDEELALIRARILSMYGDFVAAVAEYRDLDVARVKEIAQGRVWMGGDALERRLVDGYGGLADAIATARRLAGLPAWEQIEIQEYPPRPLFELPSLGPGLPDLMSMLSRAGRQVIGQLVGLRERTRQPAEPDRNLASEQQADAVQIYLHTLTREPGLPAPVLSPDQLPVAWRQTD
jgi:protease-4